MTGALTVATILAGFYTICLYTLRLVRAVVGWLHELKYEREVARRLSEIMYRMEVAERLDWYVRRE